MRECRVAFAFPFSPTSTTSRLTPTPPTPSPANATDHFKYVCLNRMCVWRVLWALDQKCQNRKTQWPVIRYFRMRFYSSRNVYRMNGIITQQLGCRSICKSRTIYSAILSHTSILCNTKYIWYIQTANPTNTLHNRIMLIIAVLVALICSLALILVAISTH